MCFFPSWSVYSESKGSCAQTQVRFTAWSNTSQAAATPHQIHPTVQQQQVPAALGVPQWDSPVLHIIRCYGVIKACSRLTWGNWEIKLTSFITGARNMNKWLLGDIAANIRHFTLIGMNNVQRHVCDSAYPFEDTNKSQRLLQRSKVQRKPSHRFLCTKDTQPGINEK